MLSTVITVVVVLFSADAAGKADSASKMKITVAVRTFVKQCSHTYCIVFFETKPNGLEKLVKSRLNRSSDNNSLNFLRSFVYLGDFCVTEESLYWEFLGVSVST